MKKTRMLSLITATAMLAGTTAGCKGKKAEKKEIKVFDAFIAAELTNESEENIIKNLIAEKIGARCEQTFVTNHDDIESIVANMIIQGEYPDFIYAGNEGYQQLKKANALVPIDEYWDDYPNLKNYFTEDKWNRVREEDGHIYMIPQFSNTYLYDTNTIHNDEAFWLQVDVLEWAGYPEIVTLDDYFELLERYVAANPVDENGTPYIPYEILASENLFFCLDNPPQFLDGYPNDGCCIVDTETREAKDYNVSPTAKRWFKKLNEEYAKGIIDKECFVMTPDQYYEKIKSGVVLGFCDQYWNFRAGADPLPDEKKYIPIGVVIDEGIEEHYHVQPGFDGSQGMSVSISCDDVDGALKFINDLLSPEILRLRSWGREGYEYSVDENGYFYLTPEQKANRLDHEYTNKVRCGYTYFPYFDGMDHDGINAAYPDFQPGEFYDKLSDKLKACFDAYNVKTYVEFLNKAEENSPWYPMWSYSNTFTEDTDYGKVFKEMEKVKHLYLPTLVMTDDFEAKWEEYMTAYKACNPQIVFDEFTAEVQRRCEAAENK